MDEKTALKLAREFMAHCMSQYKEQNPCPKCGSHNVDIEINNINGAEMSGSEWCNDCGWRNDTNTRKQI